MSIMNGIFQDCRSQGAQKPDNKTKDVYQFYLINIFKPWMKDFTEKPACEHNYANIKTLLKLRRFLFKFVCTKEG